MIMSRVRPAVPPDPETRSALGAGFVLLVTVFGSFALAYALSLTIGGIYVPFLMPVVTGLLLGTIGSFVARRFALLERRPVVLAAILGALIAYLGYHLLAYLRVLDMLAAQWASELLLSPGVDPPSAALALVEQATGHEGVFAYLAFTSQGQAAVYSPLGLFARSAPSLTTVVIVMVVELGLTITTAIYAMLWRTHARKHEGPLALVDDAALAAFREALARADWFHAGSALASSAGEPRHAVVLDVSGGAARLAIHTLDAGGRPRDLEEQRTIGEAQARLVAQGHGSARAARGAT